MIIKGLPDTLEDSHWPPVENWSPEFCGDMDLVIRRDGTWWHEGQIMSRIKMRRMFARILRLEGGQYYLVTPVEKIGIQVECTPFVITHTELIDEQWWVETAEGFRQLLSDCDGFNLINPQSPTVHWIRNLKARVTSKVLYQWQLAALEVGAVKNGRLYFQVGKQSIDLGSIEA